MLSVRHIFHLCLSGSVTDNTFYQKRIPIHDSLLRKNTYFSWSLLSKYLGPLSRHRAWLLSNSVKTAANTSDHTECYQRNRDHYNDCEKMTLSSQRRASLRISVSTPRTKRLHRSSSFGHSFTHTIVHVKRQLCEWQAYLIHDFAH